jgi:MFS family permease
MNSDSHTPALPTIAAAPGFQLSRTAAFFLLASITVSFLAGSLAPTPIYPVYQAEWGFSALTVTVIFGIYALVLLAALLVAGRLSDHIGRRPVLIAATLVQALAMLLFATASGVEGLLLARIVQGLATGSALAAIGAGMIDLDKVNGPVANAVAPPLGTALGGLLGGLVVHFLPAPTVLIYAVLAAIYVSQSIGVALMGETVSRRAGAFQSLKPQFAIPVAARRPLLLAIPVLVAGWSLAGFYGSLGPALLRTVFGLNASLAGGIAAFALAGSAAAAVLVLQRREPRTMLGFGAFGLLIGTIGMVLSIAQPTVGGFFVSTIVAGIGFGAGFQGSIRSVVATALPHERAGVLSVVFVVSYVAMGTPSVAAGFFVAHHAPLLLTAEAFGAMVAALAAVALLGTVLNRGKPAA